MHTRMRSGGVSLGNLYFYFKEKKCVNFQVHKGQPVEKI